MQTDAQTARRFLKEAAAGLLQHTGLRRVMSALRRSQAGGRRIVVVGYHRVVEDFSRAVRRSIPGTLISVNTLRRQLEEAHALGYEFASLDDALDALSGRRPGKQDLFVVTFDDGYRDVYRHAFPILRRMGIPSIIYLPTDFIGTDRRFNHDRLFHLLRLCHQRSFSPSLAGLPPAASELLSPILCGRRSASASLDDFLGVHPTATLEAIIDGLERELGEGSMLEKDEADVMDWDEVRRMAKGGVTFGAHTLGHRVLTLEPLDVVEREVQGSKSRAEQELGTEVHHFAYCNGWYSGEVIRVLVRAGFRSAVTTEDFLNRLSGDPFTLKRKILWENFSIGALGRYSSALTGCQLDDAFGFFGAHHPVPGKREQTPVPGAGG